MDAARKPAVALPAALLAWIGLVSVAGIGAAVPAWSLRVGADPVVLTWVVAGLFAAAHVVPIPGTNARVSADTLFVLVLVGIGAPGEAVLLSGLGQLVGTLTAGTARGQAYVVPFNVGTGLLAGACAAALAGLPLVWPAPMLAAALAMALVNAALVAGAMRAATGSWPGAAWWQTVTVTSTAYLASGALAAVFVMVPGLLAGVLVVGPVVLLVSKAYRIHGERMAEQVARTRDRVELFLPALQAMVEAIEARDARAQGHNRRVRALALGTAEQLDIRDEGLLAALDYGALLHDVGRIAIPDALLFAEHPLDARELEQVRRHVVIGSELIRHIPFPRGVTEVVRHHHERWDGEGYPDRLRGEEIPLVARIVAVCDAWDDIHTGGGWRAPRTALDALAVLRAEAGTAFDPRVVAAFASWLRKNEHIAHESQITPISAEISAVAREQARLSSLAFRDELTGLTNARGLTRDLRTVRDSGVAYHLLMLDLDNFKGLNDHLGHETGDRALRLVGRALLELQAPGVTAYRNGGDEFVVLARTDADLDGLDEAVRVAIERLTVPVEPDGWVELRTSVGAVRCAAGEPPDEALRRADAAMYEVKRARRGNGPRGAAPVVHGRSELRVSEPRATVFHG